LTASTRPTNVSVFLIEVRSALTTPTVTGACVGCWAWPGTATAHTTRTGQTAMRMARSILRDTPAQPFARDQVPLRKRDGWTPFNPIVDRGGVSVR
jgi:hypothetical protein